MLFILFVRRLHRCSLLSSMSIPQSTFGRGLWIFFASSGTYRRREARSTSTPITMPYNFTVHEKHVARIIAIVPVMRPPVLEQNVETSRDATSSEA